MDIYGIYLIYKYETFMIFTVNMTYYMSIFLSTLAVVYKPGPYRLTNWMCYTDTVSLGDGDQARE